MFCHSTRDERLRADCARGVLEGLAPDGGLYVPEEIPQVDARAWVNLPFLPLAACFPPAFAYIIYSVFLCPFPPGNRGPLCIEKQRRGQPAG